MTAWILSPFKELVKIFEYGLPLQEADRMVGLIPIWLTSLIPLGLTRWQTDGESICRASDSPPPRFKT